MEREQVKKENKKKKEKQEKKETPADLRSKKPKGRPSKEERSSANNIEANARALAADFLGDLKKKQARDKIASSDKLTFVCNIVRMMASKDEQGKDENEITFNMLGAKMLDIRVRVREGNKAFIDAEQSKQTKEADT